MSPNRVDLNLDPSVAAQIASAPGRPSKPAATARPKATYDLRPETIQAIRDIATELDVPVYAVAQKLLDHALEQYKLDQLELRRQAVTTAWRLE